VTNPAQADGTLTELAVTAEQAGYQALWAPDHLTTISPPQEIVFEALSVITGLARDTSRIRLGQLATSNSYRNPALQARCALGEAGAVNQPKGVQRPHVPLMIAGGGKKVTLRLVVHYADACNIMDSPEVLQRKSAVLERHCQEVGRDYHAIHRTTTTPVIIRDSDEEAPGARTAGSVSRNWCSSSGTPPARTRYGSSRRIGLLRGAGYYARLVRRIK
jgi:alkanesulfonate monooxygenase SsuD/methylene tetrahydromethanopterin reductase-like flavin-dependent oxidoreductase (luciferase family)